MSAPGGVILLSSSPPAVFARSPTPADNTSSSPALPSPASIFASQKWKGSLNEPRSPLTKTNRRDGQRRSKTLNTTREGFGNGISSSRTVLLQEKRSQENVPIVKRLTGSDTFGQSGSEKQKEKRPLSPTRSRPQGWDTDSDPTKTILNARNTPSRDDRAQSSTAKACGPRELSPLCLDKAPSRRLDWTPPASRTVHASPKPSTQSFSENSMGSFSYNAASFGGQDNGSLKPIEQGMATKRRKLDIVQIGPSAPNSAMTAPNLPPTRRKSMVDPARQRSKSPKKKYTTITGLATSHYFGEETNEASPMMQYLSATQLRTLDNDSEPLPDTAKRKKAAKRPKNAKKAPRKSALLSPQSAMKSFEQQDMLFGSASQLARDESPTLIRDTIQAIKHSQEVSLMSDPAPTQNTLPTSEPADTPKCRDKRNVSRFKRTRNLWSAAGRDEDNALLQVDTVDMFDSPNIRKVYTGKDVLLEPGAPRLRDSLSLKKQVAGQQESTRKPFGSEVRPFTAFKGGDDLRLHTGEGVIDIDELGIRTPSAAMTSTFALQVRGLRTAAAPRKSTVENHVSSGDAQAESARPPSISAPARPSFKGLTTSQLASQLSAYGFKPVKKREKMIEILDRCWDHKHNTGVTSDNAAKQSLDEIVEKSHGDFLTTVHDISARPVPKLKKPNPKGRPKKDGTASPEKSKAKKRTSKKSTEETSPGDTATPLEWKKAKQSAQPRIRKAKPADSMSSAGSLSKATSKVRTKARKAPLSEEYVVDVDDIADEEDIEISDQDVQSDNTGVKPAKSNNDRILIPMPPSSDGFETASWLEERRTPTSTIMKGTKPSDVQTPKKAHPKTPHALTAATASITPAPTLSEASSALTTTTTISSLSSCSFALPPLSSQIRLAITTFQPPPDHNAQKFPTFLQKILMYEPLILEELATWLNTEGFRSIGEDREVGPMEVREWCERESLCCLWRGGWRGNNAKGVRGQGE